MWLREENLRTWKRRIKWIHSPVKHAPTTDAQVNSLQLSLGRLVGGVNGQLLRLSEAVTALVNPEKASLSTQLPEVNAAAAVTG